MAGGYSAVLRFKIKDQGSGFRDLQKGTNDQ